MRNKKTIASSIKIISKKGTGIALAALMTVSVIPVFYPFAITTASAANMYQNSDFIETEQPELDAETKKLISLYQKDPSEENYNNLRNKVIENYDAVIAKKEAKLAELKAETEGKPGGEDKIAEMQEIVQEMYDTYQDRIDSSMLRFSDSRLLKWDISKASEYDYIPIMGAGEDIYIKYTTVTNKEYAEFIAATGYKAPDNWINNTYPEGEDNYPVNDVSFDDASAYCEWLTSNDSSNVYRLPSESEWELAVGHMPKDADFNCGINDGRTPVTEFESITRGAHGAIDFWGNVWEWTTTKRNGDDTSADNAIYGVKGGSWESDRTDCRTEYRDEGRDGTCGYEDVGFRITKVLNGKSNSSSDTDINTPDNGNNSDDNVVPPNQENNGNSNSAFVTDIMYTYNCNNKVTLSWNSINGADTYYVYRYNKKTGRISNPRVITGKTEYIYHKAVSGSTYYYLITTEQFTDRKLNTTDGIITIIIP